MSLCRIFLSAQTSKEGRLGRLMEILRFSCAAWGHLRAHKDRQGLLAGSKPRFWPEKQGFLEEAPAFDEGEEARLCGGLWTIVSVFIVSEVAWFRQAPVRNLPRNARRPKRPSRKRRRHIIMMTVQAFGYDGPGLWV